MDAKEIKSKLKSARESIRQKEYKDAIKHCKAVLSEDGNHYVALVLVGVAAEGLEQYDQAVKAYKKAINTDESQLLAWQGLKGVYEKNPSPECQADQVDVYLKLASLYTEDKEKKFETVSKLMHIVSTRNDVDQTKGDKVVDLVYECIEDTEDVTRKTVLQKFLLTVLQMGLKKEKSAAEIIELSQEVLQNTSDFDNEAEKLIINYLSILAKTGAGNMFETCSNLHVKFPGSLAATEYLALCHLDTYIGHEDHACTEEFRALVGSMEALNQDTASSFLLLAQGYMSLCNRDWVTASDLFKQVSRKSSKLVCVHYFQAVVSFRQHQCEAAVTACQNGLKALQQKERVLTLSSIDVSRSLNFLRIQALYDLGDPTSLKTAMETVENELDDSSDRVKVVKGQIYLKLGEVENAKGCVVGDSVQSGVLEGQIAEYEGNLPEAVKKFQSVMEQEPDKASHYLNLARCMWNLEDKRKECFTTLLKAAKLDPCNSAIFLYLGHYYSQEAGDQTRARKCYQKAFDLDPHNDAAGEALCDLLNEAGEEEMAHTILRDVTTKASAGSAKWAWLRLGLYQVKHDDPSVAVASFQSALRSDPKNNHVWECLGEAYLARGSLTASLKAFTKASELEPDSVYSLYQMAAIKQTLGSYQEAIEEYKLILEKSASYVPALKGLGETYLLVAKTLLSRYFHGRARDMCELAVSNLFRAASHRPDLSCLWKLTGDACTILHVLPAESFRFEKQDKNVMSKLETLELGERCYVKALKILPECSSLWHDLGINYFYQSQCSIDKGTSLAEKAAQILKKAIQLEPGNHGHWTALGLVACTEGSFKPALAQHCFIKSIHAESNNVVAWTNLAALYLKSDNVELAHEAFKVAQSLEPSYVACWIGQAIIAEVVGHEEAMDLFRHTTQLGNHLESAIGYGHWVCSMLQNKDKHNSYMYTYAIEQMAAVPAASDVLARYTDRVKTNAVAYNLHGLLLERQGLYTTAASQLQSAVEILEKTGDETEQLQLVLCNYARVLCKKGDYSASVAVFGRVANINSLEDICQLGLALYKISDLDRSYQAYAQAYEIALTDSDKSCILTAIAMVWYKFGDKDKTKSTLFQSSQMSDSSVAGLKALCALGLIQSDFTLATAALQELLKLGEDSSHTVDVAFFAVTLYILQSKTSEVKRYIQKQLHEHPDEAGLWHLLSVVLLRYYPHLGVAISASANCALNLDSKQKLGHRKQDYCVAALGQVVAGYHSNTMSSQKALSTAQNAVHFYPDDIQTWCVLVSALHADAVMTTDSDRRHGLFSQEYMRIGMILSHENLSLELRLWCHKQRTICCLHGNKQSEALESLEAMLTECGDMEDANHFFKVFRTVMQEDMKSLLTLVQGGDNAYFWQILIDMYLRAGFMDEVKTVLQTVMERCGQVKFVAILKLAHLAFQRILAEDESSANLQLVFDDTTAQILSTDSQCTVVPLMQGILKFRDNARTAKHKLRCVLETGENSRGKHELSLARQALIYILYKDTKQAELLENVVEGARTSGDTASVEYFENLQKNNA